MIGLFKYGSAVGHRVYYLFIQQSQGSFENKNIKTKKVIFKSMK